ncbi:unnamed protein product [Soboliphyme baturini]|uniref:Uncharacterized protein n=1 Tax=Soboliphyme baturini TaxID=241478 RepID=A0A183IDR4_9BILA|nr:unnamed protein product [Soboliphyme baturini]
MALRHSTRQQRLLTMLRRRLSAESREFNCFLLIEAHRLPSTNGRAAVRSFPEVQGQQTKSSRDHASTVICLQVKTTAM